MRTIIKVIWCTLLLATSAAAYTTRHANNSCSNNGNGSASTCASTSGGAGAFNSFASLVSACTTAGDTCIVESGNYTSEAAQTISSSGTGSKGVCTSCITFEAANSASVNISPLSISGSYVVINGFTITDPTLTKGSAGVSLISTTGVQILNNTITQVGKVSSGQTSSGPDCISMSFSSPSHYTTISGNTLSWCSSLSSQMNVPGGNPTMGGGISIEGDHILISNNDISHVAVHGLDTGANVTQMAAIGNTYHDVYAGSVDAPYFAPPEHDSLGCIESNNCTTHVGLTYYNSNTKVLYEGNTILRIWGTGGAHAFFSGGTTPNSNNVIVRYNKIYQIGASFIGGFYSSTNYMKVYNNTVVNSSQQEADTAGISNCGHGGNNTSSGSAYLNNLHYNTNEPLGRASAPWYTWYSECSMTGGYNLLFDSSCSPSTLANCTSGSAKTDPGNIWANPLLVATDGSNFNLQAGSPAIGAGTAPTTVASSDSGSGTSLVVNDAAYFQDGWGIPGVSADCISVTTVSNHVCVTAVNYSTNTLTLASSITRSSGDQVSLYSDAEGTQVLTGAAPNIGAGSDSSNSPPAPPTGLTGVVQ